METKFRIYIVTEGGRDVGFGHIARCIALYDAFLLRDQEPLFIIKGDESVEKILEGRDYVLLDWLKEKTKFFDIIQYGDIGIIDSYLAPFSFYERFEKTIRLPIYIDDNRRVEYPRGIVVNGSIYADEINYPTKDGLTYLLGPKYVLLRKEFWETKKKEIKRDVEDILITFGGDDIRNLTPFVLELFTKEFPNIRKNVIIGGGFKNKDKIRKYEASDVKLFYSPSSKEIKELMYNSDIAISAGGQTLYELARVGVPPVVVGVADNQRNNILGWKKRGFIRYAGWWDDKNLEKKLIENLRALLFYDIRDKISNIGISLIDGKGAPRVVEYILNERKKM